MVNKISKKYDDLKHTNWILPDGEFQKNGNTAKETYDIDKSVSFDTIRSQYNREKILSEHRGRTVSPMAAIETAIVDIAIQKSNMNQPMTVAEGL